MVLCACENLWRLKSSVSKLPRNVPVVSSFKMSPFLLLTTSVEYALKRNPDLSANWRIGLCATTAIGHLPLLKCRIGAAVIFKS